MPAPRRTFPLPLAILAVLTAACGSSTTTSTAPSTIARCSVTVRATAPAVPAGGGSGRIDVTTARECAWTASSEANWLTISGPASGQGDGSVQYAAAANGDPVTRRAAIVLNGQRAEISQAAAECVIRLSTSSAEFPPTGGSGSVRVDASSSMCSWTASTSADWISLKTSAQGQGSAAVDFTVAPTTGPPRTGTIRVANQQFSVTQSEGCTYDIAPVSGAVPASGGSGTVDVATSSGCPWTALSNAAWISIDEGGSGAGPGLVRFSAQPLNGPGRAGTLVIAGKVFTLEQAGGCSYQVAPLTHSVAAAGGTITVNVQAAPGCPWSATSAVPWVSISSGASGSGSGAVSFAVAPTNGSSRTATVTVAGQTVTVTQAQGCSYAIQPESQSVASAGANGSVNVTTGPGCTWTASSSVDWISVTGGASGSGNGTVQFTVAPTSGGSRTGVLTIAGRTFTVTQGAACSATLNPASVTVPAAGGANTFDVRTAAECSWTASSSVPWITIASGGSGSGNGTVRIEVAANAGAGRTGTVTAAGQTFTVQQESGCTIALSASSLNIGAEGGSGTVNVAAADGCAWTAAAEQPWISIDSGASGAGAGTVAFSIGANTGPERTGTIAVGGQMFTITQAGSCTFAIAPLEHAATSAGGSVAVSVTAAAGCSWTAAANVPWLTIKEGASGSGNGTVQLTIEASTAPARVGTATIAGQTFSVSQENGCSYGLSPDSRNADEDGETNDFSVKTSNAECAWTAVSTVPWITIIGDAQGTGTGQVRYSVQPNTTGERRRGTIQVESQIFTVNQRDDD